MVHCLEHRILEQIVINTAINNVNHISRIQAPHAQLLTHIAQVSNCNCSTCSCNRSLRGRTSSISQASNRITSTTSTAEQSLVNCASDTTNHTITNHRHNSDKAIFLFFVCCVLVGSHFVCAECDLFERMGSRITSTCRRTKRRVVNPLSSTCFWVNGNLHHVGLHSDLTEQGSDDQAATNLSFHVQANFKFPSSGGHVCTVLFNHFATKLGIANSFISHASKQNCFLFFSIAHNIGLAVCSKLHTRLLNCFQFSSFFTKCSFQASDSRLV